ncbi:signal peptidase I [Microbacterium sp. NPDC058342]|uniref:signal peptidase I n=1 Tax=Microbacterium sp. NPDC058342 TaxID=3346454 RepID=UPI0036626605
MPVAPRTSIPGRVARVLSATVLVLVSAVALLGVVFPLLLGAQTYTVLTGSMRPGLEPGTLIAVRAVDAADIRIGDVITFQLRSGEPEVATHRVVAVGVDGSGERVFTTRGDANDTADRDPVRAVQIRGVLVYAVPWLGHLSLWASPATKSALIVVLGLGAITWGVIALLRDASRRRRAAAAVATMIVATCLPLLAPPPAAHAAEQDLLQLSSDGTTWSDGSTITLVEGSSRIVPGDTVRTRLWVRNTAPDGGDLAVTAHWEPTDSADHRDTALTRALTADAVAPARLGPGAVGTVDVALALPASADDTTRRGSSDLVVTVRLTQEIRDGSLPRTGSEPPLPLLAAAGALVVLGAALLMLRRRRR